jgi:hypothetical protein
MPPHVTDAAHCLRLLAARLYFEILKWERHWRRKHEILIGRKHENNTHTLLKKLFL